jgi:hypothetical protein
MFGLMAPRPPQRKCSGDYPDSRRRRDTADLLKNKAKLLRPRRGRVQRENVSVMVRHVSRAQLNVVPAAPARALLQEVANIGIDPAPVLARLKLPFTPEDLRSGRVANLPHLHFARLSRECMALL